MRASTATLILAFCSMLAVQAIPAPAGPALAVRDAALGDALTARAIQVEAREEGDLEAREAKNKKKKGKKGARDVVERGLFEELEARDVEALEAREPKNKKKNKKGKKAGRSEDLEAREPKKGKKKGGKKAAAK